MLDPGGTPPGEVPWPSRNRAEVSPVGTVGTPRWTPLRLAEGLVPAGDAAEDSA
jgi:hypothetical protein